VDARRQLTDTSDVSYRIQRRPGRARRPPRSDVGAVSVDNARLVHLLCPAPGSRGHITASLALAVLVTASACGPEGPYPSREMRLVVQAAPGGLSDTVARYVAHGLQQRLGVPVVAENRVGAAGSVALAFVARSPADGYTLGYAPVDMTIIPHLGYSRVDASDFDYLSLHTRAPATITVRTESPLRSIADFVAHARRDRVTVGTSGTGSIWHLAGLAFARATGASLAYVPFSGSSQAVTALLGGHVDAVIAAPLEVHPHVEAGTLRVLGVMAAARATLLADVPTLREAGYDVTIEAWGGFVTPRGVPADRFDRLLSVLEEVLRSEEFQRFARERGLEVDIRTREAFARLVNEETARFQPLVRAAGLGLAVRTGP
jgi:tripartite-type tricarboxylate transporter receptor subunit TctC